MEWVLISSAALSFAACAGLFLMLVHQQKHYTGLVRDLTDRLMSRDLRDYNQVKNPPPPRVIVKNEPPMEDLNRVLG